MDLDGVELEPARPGWMRRRTFTGRSSPDASARMPKAMLTATEPSVNAIRLPDGGALSA
jgi:hypothetical protein